MTRKLGGGEVEMTFPIAPTAAYASLVEGRDHTAVVASLRPFFEARSVAVLGASSRKGTIGGELFRNILEGEYAGAAYPVNRNGESVAGVRGYSSVCRRPRSDRSRRRLRSGGGSPRGGALRPRRGGSCGLRDLGRVCGGRIRRRGAPAVAARSDSRTRSSASRPQLPRHLLRSGPAQRDLRVARCAPREHRVLLPERCARPGVARSDRVTWPRPVGIRLDRQQGGRLLERPARVVGGRSGDGGRPPLSGVVRQPATIRDAGPSCRAHRSPSSRSRAERRAPVPEPRARTQRPSPAPKRRSMRSSVKRESSGASSLEELIDVAALLSTQPLRREVGAWPS